MITTKILSWNVNGIRAVHKKNFMDWFNAEKPDILCFQETKAQDDQIPEEIAKAVGYELYVSSAERKGYSGVAVLTNKKVKQFKKGFGIEKFDSEGRILELEFDNVTLFNIYFPNGKQSKERLQYKMDFYDAFLERANNLKDQGIKLIVCGDVNTAHKEIDLAHPKENEKRSGFLPEERAWIDKLLSHGFVDTFRMFVEGGGHYSWWDMRTRARNRDIGWRIDYFYISENLKNEIKSAFILKEVLGSDHCPVGIEINGELF
ncbi:exodeoxyribonuclease III [candidate division KSB1 bacterium]|nr:exodeoxyribonuclease III [candidate division KSB1 bacterium]MBL7093072.1 exodeoxyribonuclease III [candidate division KSB1 bacterium]